MSQSLVLGPTSVRLDFSFPEARVVLEVKYARGGNLRRLISEMSDDVTRYGNDAGSRVLFVVYDCNQVAHVDEFIGAFASFERVRIVIVKH